MQDRFNSKGMDRRSFLGAAAAFGTMAAAGPLLLDGRRAFADEPKQGGTLRLGMSGGSTSDTLNPTTYTDWVPGNLGYQIFNGLVEIDEKNNATGELLESWEAKPGATEWVFNVRKGVSFSNGKALDADDILYSINLHRGASSSSVIKSTLDGITELKKLDANQIQITLGAGNADLPYILSDYHLLVVPNGFTDWDKPVGTGGYTLETFQPGVRAVTKRNPNYWKQGRAHFDGIELLVLNDPAARTNALISGQVDIISRLDPRTVDLLKKNPKFQVVRSAAGQHGVFPMNTTAAPFSDVNVRLALKYAIDRQKLLDTILKGYGSVGNDNPIAPSYRYYDASLPKHSYDPDKAKFYLKKANLTDLKVPFSVSEAAFTGATDAAVLFQASAAKAGITLDVKREPSDGYWDNVWMKAPFCASYWGGRPTADQILSIGYGSDSKWNDSYWKDPAFDKLLADARAELDDAKRRQLYSDAQRMLSEEGGVIIPMFIDFIEAGATKVKGMAPHPLFDLNGQRIGEKGWFA